MGRATAAIRRTKRYGTRPLLGRHLAHDAVRRLSTPFQDFSDVPDERVSIIDIGPTLARLIEQGPGSASDSLLGRSDECRVERDKTLAAGVLDWLLARVGRLLVPVP